MPKFLWSHITLTTPPLQKFFSGVLSGLSLGTCMSNLKSVALPALQLLAFNYHTFLGHMTWRCPLFSDQNFYKLFMSEPSVQTCLPNMKSIALAALELLALIGQKFKASRNHSHTPFSKNFSGGITKLLRVISLTDTKSCHN